MKTIKLLILFASLPLLLVGALAVQSNTEAAEPSKGVLADNDISQRYVVFLGGVNSSSSADNPLNGEFDSIRRQLNEQLGIERFIYFSYSAVNFAQGSAYCLGWGTETPTNCIQDPNDPNFLGLIDLSDSPVYTSDDTHQSIVEQATALDWLLNQIIKKDELAQIDLVGFSLGGTVASYWAATQFDSKAKIHDHIHSIILINSPVGGIPVGGPAVTSVLCPLCEVARAWFGEDVLRDLQLPENAPGSSVGVLDQAARNFPNKFVSIQSEDDYLVNNVPIEIARSAWHPICPCPVTVGRGTQLWVATPHVLCRGHLGGEGLATKPLDDIPAGELIFGNHNAALGFDQTVQWVLDAIQEPSSVLGCLNVSASSSVSSATILVMDISGSMDEPEPDGQRKIDAAKAAANQVLNMLQVENERGASHRLGLVTFNNTGSVVSPLTSDIEQVRNSIMGMAAQGATNIAQGLALANGELNQGGASPGSPNIVILLSDGVPNVFLSGEAPELTGDIYATIKNEILQGPAAEAANKGYCINVIGFGDPTQTMTLNDGTTIHVSIDEEFLQQIVAVPGCGKVYPADNALELANQYISSYHAALGSIVAQFGGNIAQDETTQAEAIQVPDGQGKLFASLNWPGSSLELILKDPTGAQVDDDYPGSSISVFDNLVYVIIDNPIPGDWQASVFGQDVPEGVTPYNVIFSARAAPVIPTPIPEPTQEPVAVPAPPTPEPVEEPEPVVEPPSSGLTFLLFVVGLLGVVGATAFFAVRNRRAAVVSSAGLRVIAGQASPPWASFRQGQLRVGRGWGNELVLSDTDASRHHARIMQIPQGYLLEDLGSTNGTYVNSERVERQMLHDGDVIQIGHTQVRFEMSARQ